MAVKVKYKTKLDITKDMLKNISNVNGKRIEVGCFNGDHAWLAGMPVKDTIKISDEEEFAAATPDRSKLWMIQTPQTFSYELIYQAYRVLITSEENTAEPEQTLPYDSLLNKQKVKKLQENRGQVHVTDDAMVVELLTDIPVKLVRGSYQNIKITTPEDLKIAEALCEKKQ